jgi:hypothetical protein
MREVSGKMKMRWDTDRKWLYITVTDGPSEATVSLSAAEAEVLMSVAMQTPNFIALQAEAEQRALEMLNDRSASLQSIIEERGALVVRLHEALKHMPTVQLVSVISSYMSLDKLREVVKFQEEHNR